jgi:para-nitrobenzyl esterase
MKRTNKILFHKIRQFVHLILLMGGIGFIIQCGGTENKETFLEGVFIDGPVSGLSYKTVSTSGKTDSIGVFKYKEGEDITFSVGDIVLGKTKAKIMISPVDLVPNAVEITTPTVINISMLLQTLDYDGQINNGIQIPDDIDSIIAASIKKNGRIDFDQSTENFRIDSSVTGLLKDINEYHKFSENSSGSIRNLINVADAKTHLKAFYSERKEIMTTHGKVNGFALNKQTWAWLGIPYAKPPLEGLRWQAPQSSDSWEDDLDTIAHCLPCLQPVYNIKEQSDSKYVGSEDCLYLDIYRPKTSVTDLPVYVWIHGGNNNIGSARDYDGSILARQGNMVVVVIQYRLGPMGWFTHPALRNSGNRFNDSGNYGMLDHIKALDWIKKNIAAFGGNPNNVTIGGQSSGAHNCLNLLISPFAKGLFQKAVIQSASMEHRTMDQGNQQSNAMIDWLLVKDETAKNKAVAAKTRTHMSLKEIKEYLYGKAPTEIFDAYRSGAAPDSIPPNATFQDGALLPKMSWVKAITSGAYNKVPILIGSNQFEFKNLLPSHGKIVKRKYSTIPSGNYTWEDLYKVLEGKLSLKNVLPTQRDRDFYKMIGHLKSRLWKATYVDAIARALKAKGRTKQVYVYRFNWSGGGDSMLMDFNFIFGASHGMELPFFFGSSNDISGYAFTPNNDPGRKALQEAIMRYLSNFVDTGNPNPKRSPLLEWPQWSNEEGDPKTITFDAELSNVQLSVSNTEETLPVVFADVVAAKVTYNRPDELGCMDYFGLALPQE